MNVAQQFRRYSPPLGEDRDRRRIVEPREEFRDGVRLPRKPQVGTEVVQRREHKTAQVQTRVGEDECGGMTGLRRSHREIISDPLK